VPRASGRGRIAAVEVLINTPLVAELIFKGQIPDIKELMKRSREIGMQSFDQSLFDLHEGGHISCENALRYADSVNNLRLDIKLNSKAARKPDLLSGDGEPGPSCCARAFVARSDAMNTRTYESVEPRRVAFLAWASWATRWPAIWPAPATA
jgi:hypothetical protein